MANTNTEASFVHQHYQTNRPATNSTSNYHSEHNEHSYLLCMPCCLYVLLISICSYIPHLQLTLPQKSWRMMLKRVTLLMWMQVRSQLVNCVRLLVSCVIIYSEYYTCLLSSFGFLWVQWSRFRCWAGTEYSTATTTARMGGGMAFMKHTSNY